MSDQEDNHNNNEDDNDNNPDDDDSREGVEVDAEQRDNEGDGEINKNSEEGGGEEEEEEEEELSLEPQEEVRGISNSYVHLNNTVSESFVVLERERDKDEGSPFLGGEFGGEDEEDRVEIEEEEDEEEVEKVGDKRAEDKEVKEENNVNHREDIIESRKNADIERLDNWFQRNIGKFKTIVGEEKGEEEGEEDEEEEEEKKEKEKEIVKEQVKEQVKEKVKVKEVEVEVDPKQQAEKFKLLGNQAFSKFQYLDAIEFYSLAFQLHKDAIYLCNRAAAFIHLKQYSNAIADCEVAITLQPNWAKVHTRLGTALHKLGKLEEAKAALNRGLEIEPDNRNWKKELEEVEKELELKEREVPSVGVPSNEVPKLKKGTKPSPGSVPLGEKSAEPSQVAKISSLKPFFILGIPFIFGAAIMALKRVYKI